MAQPNNGRADLLACAREGRCVDHSVNKAAHASSSFYGQTGALAADGSAEHVSRSPPCALPATPVGSPSSDSFELQSSAPPYPGNLGSPLPFPPSSMASRLNTTPKFPSVVASPACPEPPSPALDTPGSPRCGLNSALTSCLDPPTPLVFRRECARGGSPPGPRLVSPKRAPRNARSHCNGNMHVALTGRSTRSNWVALSDLGSSRFDVT